MSIGRITRSAVWIYLGSVLSSVLGYVFWIVASGFVPPGIVGSASAILALEILLVTVGSLGLSTGMRRFIGIGRASGNSQNISSCLSTTLVLVSIVNLPVVGLMLFASFMSIGAFGLTPLELALTSILMLVGFWSPVFMSLFDSLLHTEVTAMSQSISAVAKIAVGIVLLMLGLGLVAIIAAFVVSSLVLDILLLLGTRKLRHESPICMSLKLVESREILVGSIPAWVLNILTIAGQSFGVLLLYTVVGDTETGLYHVSNAIASVVYALPTSLLGLMFPVLSGMSTGREKAASDAIRLSLAFTVPVCYVLITYPFIPFIPLGSAYANAFPILALLLVGALFYPVYAGYYSFAYASKKYLHVLALGLVLSVGRIVLYSAFVSALGASGIALSFSASIIIALVAVAISSRMTGFKLQWRHYAKPVLVTGFVSSVVILVNLNAMIGVPLLVLGSLFGYARLEIVTKSDLREIAKGFLSDERLVYVQSSLKPVLRLLFGE